MNSIPTRLIVSASLSALALAGCGGGSLASVGGTVTGLDANKTLQLADQSGDTLTVSSNGTFTMQSTLSASSNYQVTVATQPTGQSCSVSNGVGTIDTTGDNISNITVTCVDYSVGGTISGLPSGVDVTLSLSMLASGASSATTLTSTAFPEGSFYFPDTLPIGSTYIVGVASSPSGYSCSTTANTTGTVASTMAQVTVTCTP
ncbi:MAG: hypothetical protein JOY84_08345 [Curvibacter sp.]|nr:hypothetical protein [Curvibacter sp.]